MEKNDFKQLESSSGKKWNDFVANVIVELADNLSSTRRLIALLAENRNVF